MVEQRYSPRAEHYGLHLPERKLYVPEGYSIALLHNHTDYGDGMASVIRLLQEAKRLQEASGCNVIVAITEHDTFAPVSEAVDIGAEMGIEIVKGEEMQTGIPRGIHVVGLFLEKEIKHSQEFERTVHEIHDQGGLAIVAHPLVKVAGIPSPTGAMQRADLRRAVDHHLEFDGMELFHRFITLEDQVWLAKYYVDHKQVFGSVVGASDSHYGWRDIAVWYTIFPGKTAQDLKQAIIEGTTRALPGIPDNIPMKIRLRQMYKSMVLVAIDRYITGKTGTKR